MRQENTHRGENPITLSFIPREVTAQRPEKKTAPPNAPLRRQKAPQTEPDRLTRIQKRLQWCGSLFLLSVILFYGSQQTINQLFANSLEGSKTSNIPSSVKWRLIQANNWLMSVNPYMRTYQFTPEQMTQLRNYPDNQRLIREHGSDIIPKTIVAQVPDYRIPMGIVIGCFTGAGLVRRRRRSQPQPEVFNVPI